MNNAAFRRTSKYDPNRDSYMDASGNYVYLDWVEEDGVLVKKVVAKIPLGEHGENQEWIRMLDHDDHQEDLQNRYAEEHEDYGFWNQMRDGEDGDDMDDTDAWAAVADSAADIEEILFTEQDENPHVEMVLAILEHLTEAQINLLYAHFGELKQLKEICDEENVANGTHKSPQAFGNRKAKLLKRVEKLLGAEWR